MPVSAQLNLTQPANYLLPAINSSWLLMTLIQDEIQKGNLHLETGLMVKNGEMDTFEHIRVFWDKKKGQK